MSLVGCHAFAQSIGNCSQRVVAGSLTTDAGDGGPATEAQFFYPADVARDKSGNLYIADKGNNRVRIVTPDGKIRTFAGTGVQGSSGDQGPAQSAQLNQPVRVAVGPAGEIYILEKNRVRRVRRDGVIETAAGTGYGGFAGDGGAATAAKLRGPTAIAVDPSGNLYIADAENGRVRRVNPAGTITTVAGSGKKRPTSTGDGQPAATAFLDRLQALAAGADGTVYLITDSQIHSVGADGILRAVAGTAVGGLTPADGVVATSARLSGTFSLSLDSSGRVAFTSQFLNFETVFTIDTDGKLKRIVDTAVGAGLLLEADGTVTRSTPNQIVANYAPAPPTSSGAPNDSTVLAGRPPAANPTDPVQGLTGGFWSLSGLATDSAGNIYITDSNAGKVRKLSPTGLLSTVAGKGGWWNGSPDGTNALQAEVAYPVAPAVSPAGEVYYSELYRYRVRKVSGDGTIVTVAGNGNYPVPALFVEGQKAVNVAISAGSLAFDPAGNLYISDPSSDVIWRVTADGILHKAASVFTGAVGQPAYLAVDPSGTIWFLLHRGSETHLWRFDEDGKAQDVRSVPFLNSDMFPPPFSIDAAGNLYFVQSEALYKVPPAGPVGGVANVAGYRTPIILDPSGNLYVADQQRLRLVEAPGATSCTPSLLPYIPASGIVNAASYGLNNSDLAPGTLITIFGQLVGPATPAGGVVEGGKFQTSAGGTQVWINDTPAPVIYASATQTTAIIPFDASENDHASVQLSVNGYLSNKTYVQLADAAPGIFTQDASGRGAGSILNQDYSINSPSNPADKGSVVMVYLTGLGVLNPRSPMASWLLEHRSTPRRFRRKSTRLLPTYSTRARRQGWLPESAR